MENTFLSGANAEVVIMNRIAVYSAILLSLACLSACSLQSTLRFEDMHIAYTPSPVLGLYGTIHNDTERDLVLEAVKSSRFRRIEIHQTTASEGRMRMEPLDRLNIPARSSVKLAPGQTHIMLSEATEPVKKGEIIPITMTLSGTTHSLEVLVRENP